MKKRWKRILSVIVSVALVAGMITISEPREAKAETTDAQKVTLELASSGANGAFTFNHSELSEEYQGSNTEWKPIRYQLDAYKDGASEADKIWIEFVGEGEQAYIWGNLHYQGGVIPTTSLHILEGTVLYQYDLDADSIIEGGKTMVLEEELKVVYRDGAWVQDRLVDVELELASAEGSWVFNHSALSTDYQGTSEPWVGVRYQFDAYKDGNAESEKVWVEFVGETTNIWGDVNYESGVLPNSSLYIPAGTIMYEYTVTNEETGERTTSNVGRRLLLTEELKVVKRDDTWVQDKVVDVTINFAKVNESGQWLFNHSALSTDYQGTADPWVSVKYQFDAYKDGNTESEKVWIEFVGETAHIWGDVNYESRVLPSSSLYIPAGTMMYEYTVTNPETGEGTTSDTGRRLQLTQELKMVAGENGNWSSQAIQNSEYDFLVNGQSDYVILIPDKATDNEKIAAEELQLFIKEASGAELPIQKEGVANTTGKFLSVGDTEVSKAAGIVPTYDELRYNGFVIKRVEDDCYIKGYSDIGTRNGIYEWLYYCFNYECYAKDEIVLTQKTDMKLLDFDLQITPSFDWREAPGEVTWDDELAYRMRFNPNSEVFVTGRSCHTSYTIIDPYKYDYTSDEYKDWFSASKSWHNQLGKELPSQLCYSNTEWWDVYVANLKEILKYSDAPVMIMGMEDNNDWCQCDDCTASKNKYGTDVATIIKFANYVQEKISAWYEAEYPEKEPVQLVIFAYHKCEVPPVNYNEATGTYTAIDDEVKLHEDLGVMFAPVRASYAYSFNHNINANTKSQLEGWNALTDNLYSWTYSLYPASPLVLLDTFDIMQENYELLLNNGAVSILDQLAAFQENGNSAWERAKEYVMSELQWDVTQDTDALLDKFFANYFGVAGNRMKALFDAERGWIDSMYAQMSQEQPNDDNYTKVAGNIFSDPVNKKYWSQENLQSALDMIDSAYAAIEGYKETDLERYEQLYDRITLESLQFRYLMIELYGSNYGADELYAMKWNFRMDMERLGVVTYKETKDISDLWKSWEIEEYNELKLTYVEVLDDGHLYVRGEIVSGPDAVEGKTIGEIYGSWPTDPALIPTGNITYIINGEKVTEEIKWIPCLEIEPHGNSNFYIEGDNVISQFADITNFVLEEGTLISLDGKTPLRLSNNWQVVKHNGAWTQYNEIKATYVQSGTTGQIYLKADIISGPDAGENVTVGGTYGDWQCSLGNVTYTLNGETITEQVNWYTTNDDSEKYNSNIYIEGDNINSNFQNITDITLEKGTILTPQSTDYSSYPLYLSNEIRLEMNESGKWEGEANEVEITFAGSDGRGFYLDAEIISGPDMGKDIADVYGEWPNPSPIGKITYTRNGVQESMMVLWSTCNDTQIYISGNYQNYVSELTDIVFEAGTLVVPQSSEASSVSMVLNNRVQIGRDGDGWTTENRVQIRYNSFDGRGFYLDAEIVAGPNKGWNLTDVYGDWANAPMADMTYVVNGERATMSVSWTPCNTSQIYVIGDFVTFVSQVTEFNFAAGTRLTPTHEAYQDKPIIEIVDEMNLVKIADKEFIDTTMLDVKVQDNSTTAPAGTNKFDIRFIGSVNGLSYKSAGFVFSLVNDEPVVNGTGCVKRGTTTVYENMNAAGQSVSVNSIYDSYSKYLFAFEITGVPAEKVIYVRSYVELKDGTCVYGKVKAITAPEAR